MLAKLPTGRKLSVDGIAQKILRWHKTVHRPLPWKGEKNPYLIWVSEIILQQTRAEQGVPYYLKFRKRFPSVESLAEASEDEVLRLWQGLGYYTRARNLHAAAKFICHKLAGRFPGDYQSIRRLKGVGEYTAAAIASFAYNQPCPVVDGNVLRVLSRLFGIETAIDSARGKEQCRALAEKLMPKKHPARYNQAVMDFGALQCVPINPDCSRCPLKKICLALKKNMVARLPVKSKKAKPKHRYFHYLVIREGNFTYLSKRNGRDIWKNLYEFPMIESNAALGISELAKTARWKEIFQKIKPHQIKFSGKFRQLLTHQKIEASFFEIHVSRRMEGNGLIRVGYGFSEKFAFPGIIRLYFLKQSPIFKPLF